MSDLIIMGIFWGAILAWGAFRFFVPTPRQRAMIAMHKRHERERQTWEDWLKP